MDCQDKVNILLSEQRKSWGLLRSNLDGLSQARIRSYDFDGFSIRLQFNPKRIISSGAKVDRESIKSRPCFLCVANRPKEQGKVTFENDYEILCNPYPIFEKHFTIANVQHIPQLIGTDFHRMLDLSMRLPEQVLFYNGPECGASAPDHLHFQSGNRGLMPIESDYDFLKQKFGKLIFETQETTVVSIDDGLRRFISIDSSNNEMIIKVFNTIYNHALGLHKDREPMMNILSYYNDRWRVLIFLREIHRPWQYYEEGEKNILLSPAAVDFGGTLIIPLEKDFNKITKEEITDIFHQISLSPEKFNRLNDYLITKYSSEY